MKPTKQELINAGFEVVAYEKCPPIICAVLVIGNETASYSLNTGKLSVTDGFDNKTTTVRTKEELSKALYFWTKKDLDFTEKVKTYTYEDCREDGIILECCCVANSDAAFQMHAMAKLSFVVEKINKAFPYKSETDDNTYCYPRYLDYGKKESWNIQTTDYIEEVKIAVKSRHGCEILIRDNKELLKQAYGIE